MGRLRERLNGAKFMIDTNCFIYLIESELYPQFSLLVRELFELVRDGQILGLTSPITITEVMTLPRRLGRDDLAYTYKLLITNFPNLSICPIDVTIADRAAALRGLFNLHTPDALQVATGLVCEASAFITFDRQLRRVSSLIEVIIPE